MRSRSYVALDPRAKTVGGGAPRPGPPSSDGGGCARWVESASVAGTSTFEATTNMRNASPFLLGSVLAFALCAGMASSLTACGGGDTGGTGGAGGSTTTSSTTSSTTSGTTGSGGHAPADGCFNYTTFDATTPAVHFKADVLPILRLSCGLSNSCHGDPNGSGGQHFYGPKLSDPEPDAATIQKIFDQSVNKTAVAEPTLKVIAPGNPVGSFLLYKLDGDPGAKAEEQVACSALACAIDQSCLSSMPLNGPALPADKRDTIRRWIAQGAKND